MHLEMHVKQSESICLRIATSKWSTKYYILRSRAVTLSDNSDAQAVSTPNSDRVPSTSRDAHFSITRRSLKLIKLEVERLRHPYPNMM